MSEMLSVLRHRNYRRYWLALIFTVAGRNLEFTALPWLVLQMSDSPLMLGVTGLIQTLPTLALTPVGGVFADRIHGQRLLLFLQGLTALLSLIFATAVLKDWVEVGHVWLFAFLLGAIRAFDQPSRHALLPRVVPREEMAKAVALGNSVWQFVRLTVPGLAGLLIDLLGVGPTFYAAGLCFLIAMPLLFSVHISPTVSPGGRGHFLRDLVRGLNFAWRNDTVSTFIGMTFFNSVFGMSYAIMMPVFARDILQVGSRGYGFLQTAAGAGAVAGGLTVAYLARSLRQGRQALIGAIAFGLLLIGFAFSPWYPLSLGVLFLVGFANEFYMTTVMILLQLRLPDELRGRVMGIFGLTWSLMPLGGALSGTLAEYAGAPVAVALGGGLVATMALWVALTKPQIRELQGDPVPASARSSASAGR